jgi:hypothetical protein
MIEHQTNVYNWKFLFLGANIDAVFTAESFGISGNNAGNWSASSVGTDSLYRSVSKAASSYRCEGIVDTDWLSEIK